MSVPGTTVRSTKTRYSGGPRGARRGTIRRCRRERQQSRTDLEPGIPITTSKWGFDPHFGLGARRAVSANNDLGVRLEVDQVDGHLLLGVRAARLPIPILRPFRAGLIRRGGPLQSRNPRLFDLCGVGAQLRDVLPKWDVGVDFKHGQNIARDHVLASDPQGVRPDSFYKIDTGIVYLSRRF